MQTPDMTLEQLMECSQKVNDQKAKVLVQIGLNLYRIEPVVVEMGDRLLEPCVKLVAKGSPLGIMDADLVPPPRIIDDNSNNE